jgi:hypothetical protein
MPTGEPQGGIPSTLWTYSMRGDTVGDVSWYTANSDNTTHLVRGKTPNDLGLDDMGMYGNGVRPLMAVLRQ